MNKSQLLMGLLLAAGPSALATNKTISLEELRYNEISYTEIQYLVKNKFLIPLKSSAEFPAFELNSKKVNDVIEKTKDTELKSFILFLKALVGDEIQINIKSTDDMTPATQDWISPA